MASVPPIFGRTVTPRWDPPAASAPVPPFSEVPSLPVTTAGLHPLFRPISPEPQPPVREIVVMTLLLLVGLRVFWALRFSPATPCGPFPEAGLGILFRIGKQVTERQIVEALRATRGVQTRAIRDLRIDKDRFLKMLDAIKGKRKWRRFFSTELPRLMAEAREEARVAKARVHIGRFKRSDDAIADAVRETGGNYAAAARRLHCGNTHIVNRVRKAPEGSLLARIREEFPPRQRRGDPMPAFGKALEPDGHRPVVPKRTPVPPPPDAAAQQMRAALQQSNARLDGRILEAFRGGCQTIEDAALKANATVFDVRRRLAATTEDAPLFAYRQLLRS